MYRRMDITPRPGRRVRVFRFVFTDKRDQVPARLHTVHIVPPDEWGPDRILNDCLNQAADRLRATRDYVIPAPNHCRWIR